MSTNSAGDSSSIIPGSDTGSSGSTGNTGTTTGTTTGSTSDGNTQSTGNGQSTGNTSTGDSSTGNTSTGNTSTGNSSTGNTSTGNSSTGNSSTGGSTTGGSSTGNSSTGNSSTGNSSTGNSSTGNSSTGNSSTGNSSTGNSSTGNSSTGNSSTGNSSTGNSSTGNSNTGSSTGGQGTTSDQNTGGTNTGNTNTGSDNTSAGSSGVSNPPNSTPTGSGSSNNNNNNANENQQQSESTETFLSTKADGGIITVTSVVHTTASGASLDSPSNSDTSSHESKPFFQNKPAVIATFTVVGIVGLVILMVLGTAALRRRRRRQMDIDAIEASMAEYIPPVDDDDPFHGIAGRTGSRTPFRNVDGVTAQKGYAGPGIGERTSMYDLGGFDTPQGQSPTPMMAQVAGYNMQSQNQPPMRMQNAAPGAVMLTHSNTTASQYSQPSAMTSSAYSGGYPHGGQYAQYPHQHLQQQDGYFETPSAANSTVGLLDTTGLGLGLGSATTTRSASGSSDGHGHGQTQESYASYYAVKPKTHSVSPSVATSSGGSATVISEGRHDEKERAMGGRKSSASIEEQDAPRMLKVANE